MSKIITKFDPELIQRAVNRIAEPIIQTLTPLGNNVMFEKDLFTLITNDGATIAKMIDSEDETEDAIIQMVKYGSLATNRVAGDGTSTTVLLTKKLVDLGLSEIKNGTKPMELKWQLEEMRDKILEKSKEFVTDLTDDNVEEVALVSASNDKTVAKNVKKIIDIVGLDGMVFLNESRNSETRIKEDSGYNLGSGMFDTNLGNVGHGKADYQKPHVFITDKKLYHVEECREILEKGHAFGARTIVILARDFLGESADFLISNHLNPDVPLNILMVKIDTKDHDWEKFNDIATYLGAKLVSEKMGKLTGKLNADHFCVADRVYSNGPRTILVTEKKVNPELTMLIEEVRKEKEENPEDDALANRLASLTSGTVTLEVGAATGPELRELLYRYEDAINAVRAALRSGYVTGGGLTLYNSTRGLDAFADELGKTSIKQIAENTGIEFDEQRYGGDEGYNAKTGKFSNLREDGVIEPYDVLKHAIINSVSVAIGVLTSGYFIVNKKEKEDGKK